MNSIWLRRRLTLLACLPALLVVLLGGCKQEELEKLTEQVKEATIERIEQQVAPIIPKTGQFQLLVDGPTNTGTGHFSLLQVGDGRPAIVQLRSYADASQETFPSIYFQAVAPVASASELVGKTLSGKLFVQAVANGPIWASADESPVSVSVQAIEESELVGSFTGGSLQNAAGKTVNITGSFRAVIEQEVAPKAAALHSTEGARR